MTRLVAIGTREAPIILDDDDDDGIIFMAGPSRLPLQPAPRVRNNLGSNNPIVVPMASGSAGRETDCIVIDDDLQDSSEPKVLPSEQTIELAPKSVQLREPSGGPSHPEIASSSSTRCPSHIPPLLKRKRNSEDVGDDARSKSTFPSYPSIFSVTSDPFAGLSKKQRKKLRKRMRNRQQETTQMNLINAPQISHPIPTLLPSPPSTSWPTFSAASLPGLPHKPLSPLLPTGLMTMGLMDQDTASEFVIFSGPNWPNHITKGTAAPIPGPGLGPMAYGDTVRSLDMQHPLPMKPGSGMPPNAYGLSNCVIGQPVNAETRHGEFFKDKFIVDDPTCTIVLEKLPRKFRTLDFVLQWCRDISLEDDPAPIHVAVDDKRAKALVEFASRDQAKRAFHSPRLTNRDGRAQICAYWLRLTTDFPTTSSGSIAVLPQPRTGEPSRISAATSLPNPSNSSRSSADTTTLQDTNVLPSARFFPSVSTLPDAPSSLASNFQPRTHVQKFEPRMRGNTPSRLVVLKAYDRHDVPVTEVEEEETEGGRDTEMEEGQIEEFRGNEDGDHEPRENLVLVGDSSQSPNHAIGRLESDRLSPSRHYCSGTLSQTQQDESEDNEVPKIHQSEISSISLTRSVLASPEHFLDATTRSVDDNESVPLRDDSSEELMYPSYGEEGCGSPGANGDESASQSFGPFPPVVSSSIAVQGELNCPRFSPAAVQEASVLQTFPVDNSIGSAQTDIDRFQSTAYAEQPGGSSLITEMKGRHGRAVRKENRRKSKEDLARAKDIPGKAGDMMDIDSPVSKLPGLGSLHRSPPPISPTVQHFTVETEDPVNEDRELSPSTSERYDSPAVHTSTEQLVEIEVGEVTLDTCLECKPQSLSKHRLTELRELVLASKRRKMQASVNTVAFSAARDSASAVPSGTPIVDDPKNASSIGISTSSASSESASSSSDYSHSSMSTPSTSASSTGEPGIPKSASFFDRMATAFLEDLFGPPNSDTPPFSSPDTFIPSKSIEKVSTALLREKQKRLEEYLGKSKLLLAQWEAAAEKSEKTRVMELIREEKRLFEAEEAATETAHKEIESIRMKALCVKTKTAPKKHLFRHWPQTRPDQMILLVSDSDDEDQDANHARRSDE